MDTSAAATTATTESENGTILQVMDGDEQTLQSSSDSGPTIIPVADLLTQSSEIFKRIERLDRVSTTFGDWYRRLFYDSLVEHVLETTHLQEGDSVLQIGCGPLPMTAMVLAESGLSVTAIDCDQAAVTTAEHAIAERNLHNNIDLHVADGQHVSADAFDAIWLAFHVHPKDQIVAEAVSDLAPGQVLIYRRPRGWARRLFSVVDIPQDESVHFDTVSHRFGKESVVICTRPTDCCGCDEVSICPGNDHDDQSTDKQIPLATVECGQEAVVSAVPDHPHLSPLGLRPGNALHIRGRELFAGPMVVEVKGRTVAIDSSLAAQIQVEPESVSSRVPSEINGSIQR